MIRSVILGLGSYVPERVVTNDDLQFLDEKHVRQDAQQIATSDEWIRARSGIEARRYVPNDGKLGSSDLGLFAAQRALADAGVTANEIDCIIFATLSPDIHFPGNGVFLQHKLGISGENGCACYDIRQQCSGFLYGLQMADAFLKTGLYRRVLLVGAELHSHSLDFTTRGRDVTVLFGDGAGAVVLGRKEDAREDEGIAYTEVHADGSGAMDLYLKIFDIAHVPYVWYDANNRDENLPRFPQMNGKKVFLHAVRAMVQATNKALADTGLGWNDIDWFVPHQANLRINEAVAEYAGIPKEKVLNTIQLYGNTTAATVPLTIDHHRQLGTVKKGDRILSTVFGSGYTWGASIFRL